MDNKTDLDQADNSLDSPLPVALPPADSQLESAATGAPPPSGVTFRPPSLLKRLRARLNVYFVIFVLLIIGAITAAATLFLNTRSANQAASITTQSLTDATMKQLANSDATVGSPKQILNVQSNAVFAGKVLVRQAVEVAGNLTVGGSLTLSNLAVSGLGTFDQIQANSLNIGNNAAVQGQLTVQKALSVSGSGSFSGPLTAPSINTSNLQLTGDLATTKHIISSGTPPVKRDGNALGAGGTSSASGADTAGTVSINTGSNPAAGCFITLVFAQPFANTPHVLITPVGSAAGGIPYYVNRSSSSFSICTVNPPPAGASFGFDYFVIG